MKVLKNCYDFLVQFLNAIQHVFLLFVHLYWGYLFFLSGTGKFENIDSVINFFMDLGIAQPVFTAYAVATIETIGGILLFFGLFTRVAAIFLTGVMITASIVAHHSDYASMLSDPGIFYHAPNFSFLMASLMMLLFGPGLVSIDGILRCLSNKKMKKAVKKEK